MACCFTGSGDGYEGVPLKEAFMSSAASSIAGRSNTRLPEVFYLAHEFCFKMHDIMLTLLKSGVEQRAFYTAIEFENEADRASFNASDDIFAWLLEQGRGDDLENILASQVFPAALSDALNLFYEALEASRKGKMVVSFILLRKPLQETLYLFEMMLIDRSDFASKLATNPAQLTLRAVTGRDTHADRVRRACEIMGCTELFDPKYVADLRYNKYAEDSFGGACDQAIHLFTDHKAIRTEALNVNFIFSNNESLISQWSFLYSRLPYLMFYFYMVTEFICAKISPTTSAYIEDMLRRIVASMLIWWETVPDDYASAPLLQLSSGMKGWLIVHCEEKGFATPSAQDLQVMASNGSFPGESAEAIARRQASFAEPQREE